MKKLFLIFTIAILLASCGTAKKAHVLNYSTPLSSNERVEVVGMGKPVPPGSNFIGSLSIGDTGFTAKCSYQQVMQDAIEVARGMGGNIIQITEHKEPDAMCSCHRIKADVYLISR